jgi:CBS domain-containing protein
MGLEYDLRQERVMHLDLSRFTTVESDTSIRKTVKLMRKKNLGCALITRGGELIGIFTDRDVLRKVVTNPNVWDDPIDTVMSSPPFTVNINDPAEVALTLMNEKHFRNVPVLADNGQVVGNLTHHALIKYLADDFPESVYNLPPEPDRVSRKRSGG